MVRRIEYIDYVKAFAIFLVVMGHAIQQLWGTAVDCDSILYRFIYSFHMPLFFFLSGFCAYREGRSNKSILTEIQRKAIALLVPYVIWGGVRSILLNESIVHCVFFLVHGGLWFLLCLFEIFACFYVLERFASSINKNKKLWIDVLVYLGFAICLIVIYKFVLYGTTFALIFDIDMLTLHFKYFIFGYLLHKYSRMESLFTSPVFISVSFILFWIVLFLEYNPYYSIINFFTLTIAASTAILIIYNYFKSVDLSLHVKPIFLHIGRFTLDIYILHMFFFTGLKGLREYVTPLVDNLIIVLILSASLSAINMAICILFSSIISKNKYLSLILLGKRLK